MRSRLQQPASAFLLMVLLVASAACSATREDGPPPDWFRDPAAGLDQGVVLVGVGSARGVGADGAEGARRAAMAAVLEQLVARVESQTDSRQRESSLERVDSNGLTTRLFASELRERFIRVSSSGELLGTRFETVPSAGADGPLTWARAVVDRSEMAEHTLASVREEVSRARAAVELASRALAPGAPTGEQTARAIQAALAADRWLAAPRAALPMLIAIRPPSPGPAASESAHIAALDQDAAELLARIGTRIAVQLAAPARVGFSGQVLPVELLARWDGAPLPGLLLAARFGAGPAASGRTDGDGRLTLSAPAPQLSLPADLILRAGPDVDGSLGAVQFALPVSFPRAAEARLVLCSRHERVGPNGAVPAAHHVSPLQPGLEQLLGGLGFPLVADDACAAIGSEALTPALASRLSGRADYLLQMLTRTVFSSADSSRGPLWYGTSVEIRLTELATGEAVTVTVAERDTKAAGASPDQAAERSLAAALTLLSRPDDPASLAGVLRARFR